MEKRSSKGGSKMLVNKTTEGKYELLIFVTLKIITSFLDNIKLNTTSQLGKQPTQQPAIISNPTQQKDTKLS